MVHLGVNSQVTLQIHFFHRLPPNSTGFPLRRGQRFRVIFHREPKGLEGLNKANHHERRFVVRELMMKGWIGGTWEHQQTDGIISSIADGTYLLTKANPRPRIEREEHEWGRSEESFSFVYETFWVELFRCLCGFAMVNRRANCRQP